MLVLLVSGVMVEEGVQEVLREMVLSDFFELRQVCLFGV